MCQRLLLNAAATDIIGGHCQLEKEVCRQIVPNMTAKLQNILPKHNAFVTVLCSSTTEMVVDSMMLLFLVCCTVLCLRALLPTNWLALLNIAVASMLTGAVDRRYHNGKSLTLCRKLKLTSDYARVRHAAPPPPPPLPTAAVSVFSWMCSVIRIEMMSLVASSPSTNGSRANYYRICPFPLSFPFS